MAPDWFETKRIEAAPVFADARLENATVIHQHGCRAAANDSGVAPMVLCNNRFCSKHQLEPGVPVQKVLEDGEAWLVQTQLSGGFWVEANLLSPCAAPVTVPKKRTARSHHILLPPPDFLMVDTLLGQGPLKLPRRRRRLSGGELVFVREELTDKESEPVIWRFFALTFEGNTPAALIIDASIPYDSALNPGWAQYRSLPLVQNGKNAQPEQLLIPIFPLPDGRTDPGWRSETKR